RFEIRRPAAVTVRMLALELRGDPAKLSARGLDGLPRRNAPEALKESLAAAGRGHRPSQPHVRPCLRRPGEVEASGHDSDDRCRDSALDRHVLADDVASAAEAPLPEAIADHHFLGRGQGGAVRSEGAPEYRRGPQNLE